jgi:GTP-sensing pleiotropic transcriptional regulator CodY
MAGRKTDSRDDDLRILRMLDMSDGDGLPASAIAERFGMTRNAVCGVLHRIRSAEVPDGRRLRKGNRNGDLPRGWWRA